MPKCTICEQEYPTQNDCDLCADSDMVYIHYDMRHKKITKEVAIKQFKKLVKINNKYRGFNRD